MKPTGKWLELDAVPGAVLDRAHRPSLFDRLDWFRLTDRHGLAGPPLVVQSGAAWLFLARTGRRSAGPLASWYSFAVGPVGEFDASLFATVAERIDALTLAPLPDRLRSPVEAALRASGWRSYAVRSTTNWTIDLAGRDFAAYWAARPGQLRSTVARRAKSHPVETRIHRAFDADAWRAYEAVYAASWKPREGSLAFLRDLAEQEGAAGTLRLGLARAPTGQAVAAQLWLVENGVATIHKLAHREDAKAGSPGSLLSRTMFEEAIDRDRVHRIDFGLGDEPYKADWVEDAAPVWRIDAYRPKTMRGAVGIARETVAQLARRRRTD